MGRARARGLPLVVVMSPQAQAALAPVAAGLGLTVAGTSPLMVLRPETPVTPSRPVKITRALGSSWWPSPGTWRPPPSTSPGRHRPLFRCLPHRDGRCGGLDRLGRRPAHQRRHGDADGDTAGISLMATPPEHQRKGWGRALLTQVMADYRSRGVARFHLGSTEAGLRLYESVGFVTVANLSAWLLPAEGALPGRDRGGPS
uniref:GNAT family N-acetyltransferase n=1 Tax=Phenylobacterium glaciei TaxID=2803784 RepID=A0A974P5H7_9CAUL|nr:GNAT family N-acetyltransferase [Phenylobacterium glaciei]